MKSLLMLFFFTVVSCNAQTGSNTVDQTKKEERLKLKNFAFCSCLNQTYSRLDSIFNDGSSAGYFETSAYSIEAFPILSGLAKEVSKKVYGSKYNRNLGMMKCLDFYNSKELDKAIIALDSLWIDKPSR